MLTPLPKHSASRPALTVPKDRAISWWRGRGRPSIQANWHNASLAFLLCATVSGFCAIMMEGRRDQFPLVATATIETADTGESSNREAVSISVRNPNECIEKLDMLAEQAASRYPPRKMTVRLTCVEKDTSRVMLYVKRGARQSHGCGAAGQACPPGIMAAR